MLGKVFKMYSKRVSSHFDSLVLISVAIMNLSCEVWTVYWTVSIRTKVFRPVIFSWTFGDVKLEVSHLFVFI